MEYREFMEQIKKDLPERLFGILEGATVDTTQVDKLQGRSYEGLSIVPDGSMIGVTMDLQPYYQMLNDGYLTKISWSRLQTEPPGPMRIALPLRQKTLAVMKQ